MKPRSKLVIAVIVAVLAVAAVFFTISLVVASIATDESVEDLGHGAIGASEVVAGPAGIPLAA